MEVGDEPVAWLESVVLTEGAEPVRVTLEDRQGSRVLVRQLDPGEPEPSRVPLYEDDEIVLMQAISHIGVNTSSEVSDTKGFLFGIRIVPVRREAGAVYARTLRRDEPDSGQRVHVRPGEKLSLEAGSVVAELDHIDDLEAPSASGYVPLAPVLWTWLAIGQKGDQSERTRYLLAAARRLDTANLLLMEVEQRRDDLEREELAGPALRRSSFELVGAVELAIVALGRALDMVVKAHVAIRSPVAVPEKVLSSLSAVTAIRNAYEHIEDRALGTVHGKPNPVALTIFDHVQLIQNDRAVYGRHYLDLRAEVPELLRKARAFLKLAAGDEPPGSE